MRVIRAPRDIVGFKSVETPIQLYNIVDLKLGVRIVHKFTAVAKQIAVMSGLSYPAEQLIAWIDPDIV